MISGSPLFSGVPCARCIVDTGSADVIVVAVLVVSFVVVPTSAVFRRYVCFLSACGI